MCYIPSTVRCLSSMLGLTSEQSPKQERPEAIQIFKGITSFRWLASKGVYLFCVPCSTNPAQELSTPKKRSYQNRFARQGIEKNNNGLQWFIPQLEFIQKLWARWVITKDNHAGPIRSITLLYYSYVVFQLYDQKRRKRIFRKKLEFDSRMKQSLLGLILVQSYYDVHGFNSS